MKRFALIGALALIARADEAEGSDDDTAAAAAVVALPGPLATYPGGPTVDLVRDGGEWMFTVTGVMPDSWLGLAWDGAAMVNQDMIWMTGDGKCEDLWSEAKKFPAVDDVQSWNCVKTDVADNKKNYVATTKLADFKEGTDVKWTCGDDTANAMRNIDWVARTTGNGNDAMHDKAGDFFVEFDKDCKVIWWNLMPRPLEEVKTGAQALAAGVAFATVAIASLM